MKEMGQWQFILCIQYKDFDDVEPTVWEVVGNANCQY